MKNPRKYVNDEHYCTYIYPKEHIREGEHCKAVRMKSSNFCYFHQPDQERVMKQLARAREMKDEFSIKTQMTIKNRKCDECSLVDACLFYEKGKIRCDFMLAGKVDLTSIKSIQDLAELIVYTETQRYLQLAPVFESDNANIGLYSAGSQIAKRLAAILKDYAQIQAIYEKNKKARGWDDILSNNL